MTKMQKLRKQFKKLQPLWDAFENVGDRGWFVSCTERLKSPYINEEKVEVELETWSPAGENIIEYIYLGENEDSILHQLYELANNYDADEHAEIWVERRGEKGVPNSIRDLIKDADEIGNMYWELYETAKEILKDLKIE